MTTDLQRRIAKLLGAGALSVEQIQRELGPMALGLPVPAPTILSALRRLQAIGTVRFDSGRWGPA